MKQNLVVFLADMYNVLEIHPAKCVRYPGEDKAQQYLDGKSTDWCLIDIVSRVLLDNGQIFLIMKWASRLFVFRESKFLVTGYK